MQPFATRLPDETMQQLQQLAAATGSNTSAVARALVMQGARAACQQTADAA